MPNLQCQNAINNGQGNMVPTEPSYPRTATPEYSGATGSQENDLKNNFMKMIDVLKEKIKHSLKEIEGRHL